MTALDLAIQWAKSPRILIVDDDQSTVKALTSALAAYECEVIVVGTVAEGLNAVFDKDYDLIIVGLGLSDGSGATVVKAVKAAQPSVPVALVYGALERFWLEEALTCGAVTLLRKPFDITAPQFKHMLEMFKVKLPLRSG